MFKNLCWMLLPFFTAVGANAESVILNIGEEFRLPLPSNHRVWVQNRKSLKATARGSAVILTAVSEGRSSALIGRRHFEFQVVLPSKRNLFAKFQKRTQRMLGLKFRFAQQQVRVEGKLLLWEDWRSLAEISRDLEVPYDMAAEITPSLKEKAQSFWLKRLEEAGLPPAPVQFAEPLQVRLSAKGENLEKYRSILGPFGIAITKDEEAVQIAPVIKVEITVAEINRDFSQSYGIQWPSGYKATILPDGKREFENFALTANALESQGKGRILASPSLLCRSGKEAEFLAGGEFPIKIMNMRMQDVVWKKYGILLKVRPKADSSGRMSIALDVEVSTIDGSREVDGIPGLLTNRISSHFDLLKSQTIALSGLIKNEDRKSSSGLPFLQRIPVMGALFSSKQFQENRTELVIFVRPSIFREDDLQNAQPKLGHLGEVRHAE